MSSPDQNLDHLKIPLEDILLATNHFSNENFIRQGGFGKIYKGILERFGRPIDIVARRLDTKYGQGSKQFWTEILMLSKLKHHNLVSLVGFCDEKNEMIVVNKRVALGSLDNYIGNPSIPWPMILRICSGIASAISYIYYDKNRDFSVIHRNIKSSKILLDGDYNPQLAGFELSITTVASQRDRLCIDDACGSTGYVDPTYAKTGSVTHKSDMYSFGIVLFEVLSGTKAITDNRDTKLAKDMISRYEKESLYDLVIPYLRAQVYGDSFKIVAETAYDCLKEHRAGRPNINQVLMKLRKASHINQISAMTSAHRWVKVNPILEKQAFEGTFSDWKESQEEKNYLQISLADIKSATQDFSPVNLLGEGGFGKVYSGKLPSLQGHKIIAVKRLDKTSYQGETELMTELVILSEYKHKNIIELVSYCNENGEKIIVYDYAARGSLEKWLKRNELTWRKRLAICVDIARGLDFLHGTSDVKQDVVIHRDIKSANILLHDDWKASIADFGLSLVSPINQDINYVIDNAKGTPGYCDPLYITTKTLTKESDIYSLGVLLFEILCGRFVMERNSSRAQNLVHLAKHRFKEGTLYEMVFAATKKQMAPNSWTAFRNIAYQCIHEERSKRPTAYDVLIQLKKALEHQEKWELLLNISLDNIMLATQDFTRDNLIEKGEFWSVYKGQITLANGCEMIIAVKRLDRRSDQPDTEHMAELEILLEYTHENIISLIGYCNEKEEKIMVYDYASISKGSLDRWLKYDGLTWRKRLEICIDIAKGLVLLHETSGAKQDVVIHGDIKSSNVLLHDDWKAKIANFGCSLISPINQEMTYVVNNAKAGTPDYCDPLYITTGVLTKESDIYSFGVLLLEILCGRFVMDHNSSRAQSLVHLVRHHFVEGTLSEIVFEAIKKQMVPKSLTTFLNIAQQCLHEERLKRPTANDALIQLKKSLELQEDVEVWEARLPRDYKQIIQMIDSHEINFAMSYKNIYTSLCRGSLLRRNNKVWFSIGATGKRVQRISAAIFHFTSLHMPIYWTCMSDSRFGNIARVFDSSCLKIQITIKTQLLSPGVNYGVYLLYKFETFRESSNECIELTFKIGDKHSHSHRTEDTADGWSMIQLYQFTNLKKGVDIDIFVEGFSGSHFKNQAICLEGVEFRAINNMTDEEIKELEKVNIAEAQQSPTYLGGHILRFLLWVLEKCALEQIM